RERGERELHLARLSSWGDLRPEGDASGEPGTRGEARLVASAERAYGAGAGTLLGLLGELPLERADRNEHLWARPRLGHRGRGILALVEFGVARAAGGATHFGAGRPLVADQEIEVEVGVAAVASLGEGHGLERLG